MKTNSKFYVVDKSNDALEFVISEKLTDDGVEYKLLRSKNDTWADPVKGEVLVTLIDDGNGYKFKWKQSEKKRIGYDELEHLYLLINHARHREDMSVYNICQYE